MDFNSVLIRSDDPKRLTEHYGKLFGEPAFDTDGYTGWQLGTGRITVGPHSEVSGKNPQPGRMLLNIESSDVKGEFDKMKAAGATVVQEPYQMGDDPGWIPRCPTQTTTTSSSMSPMSAWSRFKLPSLRKRPRHDPSPHPYPIGGHGPGSRGRVPGRDAVGGSATALGRAVHHLQGRRRCPERGIPRDDMHNMRVDPIARWAKANPAAARDAIAGGGIVTVPVAFHVLRKDLTVAGGNAPLSWIEAQIDVLNESYSGATGGAETGFRFELASVDRTTKPSWFKLFYAQGGEPRFFRGSHKEIQAKKALRVGGPETLNVYTGALGKFRWAGPTTRRTSWARGPSHGSSTGW